MVFESPSDSHGTGSFSSVASEASKYCLLSEANKVPGSKSSTLSQCICILPFDSRPEKSRGFGPSDKGSHINASELYESPSQIISRVSRMVGCHEVFEIFPWNNRTALSSAVVVSHIQMMLGASSCFVARSADDASKSKREQPDWGV